MDRLLVLRLDTQGCEAEAWLNGVPLLRSGRAHDADAVTPPEATAACCAVHEYSMQGPNHLQLWVHPSAPDVDGASPAEPEPQLADGQARAHLRLLLPRTGSVAHPDSARTLAQIDFAPPAGELVMAPVRLEQTVSLPINFPRWRWLDAPPVPDAAALRPAAAAWLLNLVMGVVRGQPEPLLQASRLKLEEVAAAYQRAAADDAARLHQHLVALPARGLKPVLPTAAQLCLRPVAGGRLIEALRRDGTPAMQGRLADGTQWSYPMRLAVVDGQFYGLR